LDRTAARGGQFKQEKNDGLNFANRLNVSSASVCLRTANLQNRTIGLAGAFALGRVLANLIYGVKPTDPITFGAVSVLLAGVGVFASIIPAYRATRVEPMKTLRDE
jgi:ABC-type lipoprotein release transport system permease subunit